jgi:hypothetical protein
MNRQTVTGERYKTSEMAAKKKHQWGAGILDRQAAAASDFTARQYGKMLVKITIMTNSWHNKHYRGSYVGNVTSEQIVALRSHFQHLHKLFIPKSIRITQVFISHLTSGVPHNCAASTEQHETNTIPLPPFRLIAVLCSAIRRTKLSACNVHYIESRLAYQRLSGCSQQLVSTLLLHAWVSTGKTTSKPV